MSKKVLLSSLVVIIASLGAAGAFTGSASPNAAKVNVKPKITMISFAGSDYFGGYVKGAKARAAALGLHLNVQLAANYNASTVASAIDAVAATRPEYLLVPAVDSVALRAPLLAASKRGIKVITFDTQVANPTFVLSYVNVDYHEYGFQAGGQLSHLIGGHGKVLLVNVAPGNEGLEAFAAGFKQSLPKGVSTLPQQYDQADPAKSNAIVRAVITRNPDLAGIVVFTGGGEGGVAAVRQAGKVGKVKIVEISASAAAVANLKAGYVQVIVSEPLGRIGASAVQAAYNDANGRTPPRKVVLQTCVLTSKNVGAAVNAPCLH